MSDAVAAKLFIVHFSAGPSWDPDKPPNEQTSFGEHGRNLKRLRDEGSIVLGARYGDKGMIVLRSLSEDEARAILSADPGVVAGIFTFEVFELRPFYSGCLAVEPRPTPTPTPSPSSGGK
ncbi:MAG: YciI family protein [bacterium]